MNINKNIKYYIHCFNTLRRDRKKGGAPHKPILLLSVINLIEKGYIATNRIYLTPELVSVFKNNWGHLVKTDHHMLFTLPYYHMKSEPFWRLKATLGCEKWVEAKSAMKTFKNLNEAVDYAEIDMDLFLLFKNKPLCNELKLFLLDKYFPETKRNYPDVVHFDDLDAIGSQIIEEPATEYQNRIKNLEKTLGDTDYEQEIFIRSSIFTREIPKIYNYACCISGLRIDATVNV